ncbi:MAG: prepilin-type N-terminal cleavage/methylation domain-containing protein [Halanaerobium sp.]|nr:prepilin-type N-terminal cleavage/methylation domain-containing protein [Halanaerobium sp.]
MNRISRLLRSKEGFTLIELMIVIVVIGILAAIAVPRIADVRSKASVAVIKSDLHNIQTSLEMFYVEHDQYPDSATLNSTTSTGTITVADGDDIVEELNIGLSQEYTYSTITDGYRVQILYDGTYYYVENGEGVTISETDPSGT